VDRFLIVPDRSRVRIEATSSLHPIHGEAGHLEGFLEAEFGADGTVAWPARARIEVALESMKSGNRLYDREMLRRADARHYPMIVGELTGLDRLAGDRYHVSGDLTFHGVTRRVEGEVRMEMAAGRLQIRGTQVFDIREFDLEPPRILMLRVHPEVTVHLEVVAEKQIPEPRTKG
jgi:YceI-like domain